MPASGAAKVNLHERRPKRSKAEVSRALAPHLAALHAKYGDTAQTDTDRAAS